MSDHYERCEELYAELGEVDGWYCPASNDFVGWYNTRPGRNQYDGRARPWALGKEFPGMRQDLDRVIYSTVNYVPKDWFTKAWKPYSWVENDAGTERSWKGDENPMPGYGDIRAYAPFADIDLADGVKENRPSGDIPQKTIERALELYLEGFADLSGDRSHVFALDSVGGAYAFVAPTATTPIAKAVDRHGCRLILGDMMDRLNEWLQDLKEEVNAQVPDAEGVFEPDLLNNKNRLFKAPMSLHSSLDGVVTPVDVAQPSYRFTPADTVDGDMIEDAEAWAGRFTGDHTEAVASIVATLWPGHYADADSWKEAVAARVEEIQTEENERRERKESQRTLDDIPEDLESTDDIDVITAKIDAIDAESVVRRFCDRFDTAPGRNPPRFEPGYRPSESGQSCFVDRTDGKIVDLDDSVKAIDVVHYVAREQRIVGPKDTASGSDWWKAVNELRKAGYDIPYYTGKDGTHPDGLRFFEDADSEEEQAKRTLLAAKLG